VVGKSEQTTAVKTLISRGFKIILYAKVLNLNSARFGLKKNTGPLEEFFFKSSGFQFVFHKC